MGLFLPLDCFDVEVDMAKPTALVATRRDAAEAGQWTLCAYWKSGPALPLQ